MRTLSELLPQRNSITRGTVARLLLDMHAAYPNFNPPIANFPEDVLNSTSYIISLGYTDNFYEGMVQLLTEHNEVQFDSIEEDEEYGLMRWVDEQGSDQDSSSWVFNFLIVNGQIILVNDAQVITAEPRVLSILHVDL